MSSLSRATRYALIERSNAHTPPTVATAKGPPLKRRPSKLEPLHPPPPTTKSDVIESTPGGIKVEVPTDYYDFRELVLKHAVCPLAVHRIIPSARQRQGRCTATSALGLGSPWPHLGSRLPHLHRNCGSLHFSGNERVSSAPCSAFASTLGQAALGGDTGASCAILASPARPALLRLISARVVRVLRRSWLRIGA